MCLVHYPIYVPLIMWFTQYLIQSIIHDIVPLIIHGFTNLHKIHNYLYNEIFAVEMYRIKLYDVRYIWSSAFFINNWFH